MIHLNWVKLTNAPESWPSDGERVFVKVGEKTSIAKCYNRTAMRTFLGTRHNPTHWAPMSCMNLFNKQFSIKNLRIGDLLTDNQSRIWTVEDVRVDGVDIIEKSLGRPRTILTKTIGKNFILIQRNNQNIFTNALSIDDRGTMESLGWDYVPGTDTHLECFVKHRDVFFVEIWTNNHVRIYNAGDSSSMTIPTTSPQAALDIANSILDGVIY